MRNSAVSIDCRNESKLKHMDFGLCDIILVTCAGSLIFAYSDKIQNSFYEEKD